MKDLYEKRGRRYYPVCAFGTTSHMFDRHAYGFYLMHIQPGQVGTRPVDPDYANTEAALRIAEDAMVKAMLDACKLRPSQHAMSPKEIAAWDVFRAAMGDEMPSLFQYASLQEIADAGLAAIRAAIRGEES